MCEWENILFVQFNLAIQDGGNPPLVGDRQASVTINIIRNRYTPQWTNTQPYDRIVARNVSVNTPIVTVEATDADPSVRYSI